MVAGVAGELLQAADILRQAGTNIRLRRAGTAADGVIEGPSRARPRSRRPDQLRGIGDLIYEADLVARNAFEASLIISALGTSVRDQRRVEGS